MKKFHGSAVDIVPEITHSMGRHWDQPDRSAIRFTHGVAEMSAETFAELLDYSTSIPTGVYDGKMWKREMLERLPGDRLRQTGRWYLCWYGQSDDADKCSIEVVPIASLRSVGGDPSERAAMACRGELVDA